MSDVRQLFPLYALGILDPDEALQVERAVAADVSLAAELASFQEGVQALVQPVAAPPELKARLLTSAGGGPLERFSSRMATLFDVTVDRAREILGLIDRPASWEVPVPGVGLIHFDGGPAYAAADCGFVRLAPGTAFPVHTHVGEEVSLIIAGALRDQVTGRMFQPGDELVLVAASEHDVICAGETDCIFAARAMHGIEIAGAPARPPGR